MAVPTSRVTITSDVGDEHADLLEEKLQEASRQVAGAPAQISVALVDTATMARLHEQFLKVAGPTDVLTFELDRDIEGRVSEAEIVICLDVAAEQARVRGHPVVHELLLYAVHGLLHLSGYDDQDAAGYAAMHAREDQVLTALGLGPVFSRPDL